MKEFFTILFYVKVFLLTPEPINIEEQIDLSLRQPVVAITSGAEIRIDVSSMFEVKGISETRQNVSARYPDGCLTAVLHGKNVEVPFQDEGIQVSNDTVRISLSASSGVLIDIEFSRVSITSCATMTGVEIYWANHRKWTERRSACGREATFSRVKRERQLATRAAVRVPRYRGNVFDRQEWPD